MAEEHTIHSSAEPETASTPVSDLPQGNHPAEVAARSGFGPLSAKAAEVWHGYSEPCVSCGQLVPRDAQQCHHCGQVLTDDMLAKMRAHAGPWFVLEHVRPFPGVSLDRLVRQIQRGVLTPTSIVRGPATDYQWRYAVETPGLCLYFEQCWNCHEKVKSTDRFCSACLSRLSFDQPAASVMASPRSGVGPAGETGPADGPGALRTPAQVAEAARTPAPKRVHELADLSAAVDAAKDLSSEQIWDEPLRVFGISATWLAGAILILVIAALMLITHFRQAGAAQTSAPSTAFIINPRHF